MGKRTLFVAAGHGGADPGNTGTGAVEADELKLFTAGMRRWLRAQRARQKAGGVVLLDDGLDLRGEIVALERWRVNAADGDLAVDLHLDYHRGRDSGGALVIYDEHALSQDFGTAFLQQWCAGTGIPLIGCFRSVEVAPRWRGWRDYGWTAQPWPGLILELGTLNCPRDLQIVRDGVYQAFAAALLLQIWQRMMPGERMP